MEFLLFQVFWHPVIDLFAFPLFSPNYWEFISQRAKITLLLTYWLALVQRRAGWGWVGESQLSISSVSQNNFEYKSDFYLMEGKFIVVFKIPCYRVIMWNAAFPLNSLTVVGFLFQKACQLQKKACVCMYCKNPHGPDSEKLFCSSIRKGLHYCYFWGGILQFCRWCF